MNIQEWLEQIKKLDKLIDTKSVERRRLMDIATDISPRPMDGMPFENTGTPSRSFENAVANLIALTEETDKLIDEYIDIKEEIIQELEKLPVKEYEVLHNYYVGIKCGERTLYPTWERIAELKGMSVRQIYRIRDNGLEILPNVIECHVRNKYNIN